MKSLKKVLASCFIIQKSEGKERKMCKILVFPPSLIFSEPNMDQGSSSHEMSLLEILNMKNNE